MTETNQDKSKTCDCGNCSNCGDCGNCGGHGMWGGGRAGKSAMFALTLLGIFLIAKTVAEVRGWNLIGKDIAPQATIVASGKGEVLVKPDIATFSFGVESESLSVTEAQDRVAKSEKSILDFLDKNGIRKDDIKVSGYSIYPRYEYRDQFTPVYIPSGARILAGYSVSESVEVKVRKIADAGKIIGELGGLGATNISGLAFSVDKEEEVIKEARAKAIADARESARKLAKDLGVSLVRIVNFSESGSFPPPTPIYYKAEAAYDRASGIATPELPSGTSEIVSQVSITYEIR